MNRTLTIKCKPPSCSNTFEIYKSELGRKTYCSRTCRSEHHWSTFPLPEKKCKNPKCDNMIQRKFKSKLDRVHYCCGGCKTKHENMILPTTIKSNCKMCLKEIINKREPCGKLVSRKMCDGCLYEFRKNRAYEQLNKIKELYATDQFFRDKIKRINVEVGKKQKEKYKKDGLPPKWIKWYTDFSSFGRSKIEDKVVKFLQSKVANIKRWYQIVIECQGDYWHMNPNKYSGSDYNKTTKKTASEHWEKDKNRRLFMEYAGYTVVELWESEINNEDYSKLDIYL